MWVSCGDMLKGSDLHIHQPGRATRSHDFEDVARAIFGAGVKIQIIFAIQLRQFRRDMPLFRKNTLPVSKLRRFIHDPPARSLLDDPVMKLRFCAVKKPGATRDSRPGVDRLSRVKSGIVADSAAMPRLRASSVYNASRKASIVRL